MPVRSLKQSFLDFIADESGSAQVEKALIVTLVSVGIIASLSNGDAFAALYDLVAHEVDPPPLMAEEEAR